MVKTQMKCRMMLHFIMVCTVCLDQTIIIERNVLKFRNLTCDPLKCKMDKSMLIVALCMGKLIRMKRTNTLPMISNAT